MALRNWNVASLRLDDRHVYPNVLHIERPQPQVPDAATPAVDRRSIGHRELFQQFFREMSGEALTDDQAQALDRVLESVIRATREVSE